MISKKGIYVLAIIFAVAVNVFSWHLPFFWDTILTSTITQHFYEYGFQNFISPAQFDAGHPPLFYIYVTGFYHLFGEYLFVAHLSMLPFTLLGILSFIKILEHFKFDKKQQFIGLILFFSIPAVVTQYTLVSYDAVLLSLYLTALLFILKNKKILFAIISICIVGISLRGLFCVTSLSITIFFLEKKNIRSWLKWNLYFVPAVVIISVWFYYHYTQTGWLLSTNAEGWSQQRGFVNAFGLFKNGVSIARCFFDLGIVIISLLSMFYVIQKKKFDSFTLLWLIPFLIFAVSFLPFTNPINHRYFLIVYVLMLFQILQLLSDKKIIYSLLTICILLLGHFLIYPVPISNGWDCTLQYKNYTDLKGDFELYLNTTNINRDSIGTVFPMNASLLQTNMVRSNKKMINVNAKSIDSIPYILYSNIGNDFSDEQIIQLSNWIPLYKTKQGLVELVLFRNPKINPK